MRLRIIFAKSEAMRYTSHLDLYRTWERTVRRADLPLAYSQGFKPHPKINIASALPLGYTGEAEIVDIWLESEIPLEGITSALQLASPPGIQIKSIHPIDLHTPTLQTTLVASEYLITFLDDVPELESRINETIAASSLPRQRGMKGYNLRPLILDIQRISDDDQGRQCLITRLSAVEGATGRPDELVLALGGVPEATLVKRIRLIFAETQPESLGE